VLEANPGYREVVRDGVRLPRIGGVEISIMEETQSRWLAFQRGDTDIEYQLAEVAPTFITADGRLKPEFAKRGIKLERSVDPEIIYLYFQHAGQDGRRAVEGAHRAARAIAMAYKIDDQIRIIRKGQAIRAHYPIPPGIVGHDPEYRSAIRTTRAPPMRCSRRSATAKARTATGASRTASRSRSASPRRPPSATASSTSCGSARSMRSACASRSTRTGSRADQAGAPVPADAARRGMDRRLPRRRQLHAAAVRAEHRAEQQRLLPLAGIRQALREIAPPAARRGARPPVSRDDPGDGNGHAWILTDSRYRNVLLQPRVRGFTKHPVLHTEWLYIDLE
jgi:hypothetical protein